LQPLSEESRSLNRLKGLKRLKVGLQKRFKYFGLFFGILKSKFTFAAAKNARVQNR